MKQLELDKFEQQILTDIFGGYTSEYMVIQKGIFKFNVQDKVQDLITSFEQWIKPYMNDDGLIDGAKLNTLITTKIISIPNYTFRLLDFYDDIKPLVLYIMKGLL